MFRKVAVLQGKQTQVLDYRSRPSEKTWQLGWKGKWPNIDFPCYKPHHQIVCAEEGEGQGRARECREAREKWGAQSPG